MRTEEVEYTRGVLWARVGLERELLEIEHWAWPARKSRACLPDGVAGSGLAIFFCLQIASASIIVLLVPYTRSACVYSSVALSSSFSPADARLINRYYNPIHTYTPSTWCAAGRQKHPVIQTADPNFCQNIAEIINRIC
jgi:hypothetical protein